VQSSRAQSSYAARKSETEANLATTRNKKET